MISVAFMTNFRKRLFYRSLIDFQKLTRADGYLLDEDSFRLRSRLAWVDLLLQSYKVFAMADINVQSLANHEQLLQQAKSIDR